MNVARILCPVDFSDASQHAIEHALMLAKWYHAPITALHAYGSHRPSDEEVAGLRTAAAAKFRPAAADDGPVEILVQAGDPVTSILDAAISLPADVIVMGTHGLGGFQHLVLGSVAEKVVRRAGCPVFTVPPRAQSTSALPFARVLCAVDFSPSSDRALHDAASLAKEASATLTLVHVLEWPWPEPPAPHFDELPPDQRAQLIAFRQQRVASAHERLESLVPAEIRGSGRGAVRVVHGKAYVEIMRLASDEKADLIVMGVHSRSTVGLSLLGSTANQVVRHATCPVLTIRH
jgi:nucleotide-binding universal stress UspA family protein